MRRISSRKLSQLSNSKRLCICMLVSTCYFFTMVPELHGALEDMTYCPNAVSGTQTNVTPWKVPGEVLSVLKEVERIFVLAKHDCSRKLPLELSERVTCIRGVELDKCAPRKYLRGRENHAMKVTYAHAFVMARAHEAHYSTIAVVEEDANFLERNFSSSFATDFASLIHSSAWGLIRLGFRPIFLQMNGILRCPQFCRCSVSTFGDHLCKMRHAGCDMRSSDMYIINQKFYLPFRAKLLNLRVSNRQRIVDTLPMNRIGPQWLVLPQLSFQTTLDVPIDYQIGLSALYVRKCAGPRPLPDLTEGKALYSLE